MKELVEFMAKALVDSPEEVAVHSSKKDRTTLLELTVADKDLGRVIGRHGRTAMAMRLILEAAAEKTHQQAALDILE
jgi:hypothetical protein